MWVLSLLWDSKAFNAVPFDLKTEYMGDIEKSVVSNTKLYYSCIFFGLTNF